MTITLHTKHSILDTGRYWWKPGSTYRCTSACGRLL